MRLAKKELSSNLSRGLKAVSASTKMSNDIVREKLMTQAESFVFDNRFLTIETPSLKKDKLLLRSFSGSEGISQLFYFQLDLLSRSSDISFDQIVGHNVTIGMPQADWKSPRYFNGVVSRFTQLPNEGEFARYQAEVVPWLWFLTRTADCLIFQKKTIPDILAAVFKKFDFSNNFEMKLKNKYREWEYCVQYRETACNFVMRLMEQEGIFFFFRHEKGKHTLVMADSAEYHESCPYQPAVSYSHSSGPGAIHEEDKVQSWRIDQELRPNKYALGDFNFTMPGEPLLASVEGGGDTNSNKSYGIYDYPGEYKEQGEGKALARIRLEEETVSRRVITGSGNCRSFTSGYKFKIEDHERSDQNGDYVLTSISHHAQGNGGFSAGSSEDSASFSNIFTCIPLSVPFRPPRLTPKPLVQGCQTATVVGDSKKEIDVDKYGRILVKFHWDRRDVKSEERSCRIRVSQPWAGKGWGAVSLPRVGQEVVVDFLEGDPDRPLIIGRVYNEEQMPPYTLPAHATQSGIKTRSTTGGNADHFNEMRFEDKKGKEEIYLHAEKQLTIMVEQDKGQTIGHDETLTIKHDRTKKVEHDEKTTITGNRTETIEQGNESMTLVAGDREVTIATGCDNLSVGQHINTSAKLKINIQAGVELNLIGPGGSIKIDATGVTIQGVLVKIN